MKNLGKRPSESGNGDKVLDPEPNVKIQIKVKLPLPLKLLHKNSEQEEEVCRKGRTNAASTSSQGFLESIGMRLNGENEGSRKWKRIWRPYASSLPDNSIFKAPDMNLLCKYEKHVQMRGSICCWGRDRLTKFVECPKIVRKKRSFSYHNQLPKTLENTLGSLCCHGKRQKRAAEKFVTLSTHSFLPEEVVEEVLSRLPVKSVARFRCVCRSWQHLTYSERFISLHVKNFRTTQLIVGSCDAFRNVCSMYFLPPPPPTGSYSDKHGAPQKTEMHGLPSLFGGSCNGIVCLYNDRAKDYIALWNPATNETKMIRNDGFPRNPVPVIHCTVMFGFDPNTNDYKILQMVCGEPNTPVGHMELYSLRKGSWKKVSSHDFSVVCGVLPANVVCSLPFTNNRIVCAVVSPLSGTSKWGILSFDMSTEVYEVIPVSATLDAELGACRNRYHKKWFKLFPYKETIAFAIAYCTEDRRSYRDIWVLNGGFKSSTGQSRSWSKILTTDVIKDTPVPIGCWGSSQILFQKYYSQRLLSLDYGTNMMVELGVDTPECVTANRMVELGVIPHHCITSSVYQESLVRIDEGTNQTNDNEKPAVSKCLTINFKLQSI